MESISEFLSKLLAMDSGTVGFSQALASLGIAYLGGILSSLTPCVYPMIPITVGVIGGMSLDSKRAWQEVLLRALGYLGGMTLIYSFLGVAAGLTGRIFGSYTNTPGWYLGLGIVMSMAALMMMDVIPFDPAVWIEQIKRRYRRQHTKGHGRADTLHTHRQMTFGFIAAPCTTPVLTSILAFIANTQSVGLGLGLMIAFSLGLGTLLILIAIFTGALKILPRSGHWLRAVKIASGLILLAFADYLIYRAGTLGGP
jgi:cytochrome c-type biogenesis protein